jgi:hypothetical protein
MTTRYQALVDNYFDPAAAEIGDRCDYRDEDDATDDFVWNDAIATLQSRGLELVDFGGGYRIAAISDD